MKSPLSFSIFLSPREQRADTPILEPFGAILEPFGAGPLRLAGTDRYTPRTGRYTPARRSRRTGSPSLASARPLPPRSCRRTSLRTRRVRLVRGEGRGVST